MDSVLGVIPYIHPGQKDRLLYEMDVRLQAELPALPTPEVDMMPGKEERH